MSLLRLATAILGAVLAAAPAIGQEPLAASPPAHSDPARFLGSFVHLTIVNSNGDTARASSRLIRAVDVNGAVRVSFDRSALTAYRPAASTAVGDTIGRRVILQLLDDLAEYGQLAAALAQSVSQAPPAFDSARVHAERWYGTYVEHVDTFFQHQVRLGGHEDEDVEMLAAQAAQPYMGRERMGDFVRYLRSELVRLLREAEQSENAGIGMLSLVAWRITPQGDSVRVGLRGYDTTAAQGTTLVSKITTVMTADENASVRFHRDLAAKVHNVRDLFASAFEDYIDLAVDARKNATTFVAALEMVGDALRVAAGRPDALVNAVPDSAKAAARRVGADIREMADWLSSILTPLRALREDLRSVGAGDQNPLIVLSSLSSVLDTAAAVGARVRRLEPLVRTFTAHLKELGLQVRSVDDLALPDSVLAALTRATAAYGRLAAIVRHVGDLLPHGQNVRGVAAAFDEDWLPRLSLTPRDVATAPETEILLTKAGGDRTEGDLLVFRADLLNPDRTPVGSYEWTFRLEKLGVSSRFAAGVGFAGRVFAQRNPDEALRPVPVLAWVLRHRTRGESGKGRLWNFVDPSVGVHIVTLSGDTQAVQFGLGVSLNLLQDFAQLGMGRKLQPESADDRYYWYFGLGLFKLVRLGQ